MTEMIRKYRRKKETKQNLNQRIVFSYIRILQLRKMTRNVFQKENEARSFPVETAPGAGV